MILAAAGVYSLPVSGIISDYREHISKEHAIQFLFMIHLITTIQVFIFHLCAQYALELVFSTKGDAKMRRLAFTYKVTLLLIFLTQMICMTGDTTQASPVNPSLLQSLRQGGYILYVRHGEATVGEDQQNLVFSDCSTQRNLSEQGKRDAVRYGEALRNLKVPTQTPVLASPFCRTRETAELAFGVNNVQIEPFWVRIYNLSGNVTPSERNSTLAALTSLLETVPSSGKNTVIISHSFPDGVGLGEIPYLGTVVIKPRGQGKGYEVVEKIPPDELLGLQ